MLVLCPALARFTREAAVIGRLLAGYTAIEYQLCMCAGMGGGDIERAIEAIFSRRGKTNRVNRADALGRASYASAGLDSEFRTAIGDTLFCVRIRNQYAHCIWHGDRTGRLAFAHLEEIAAPGGPEPDPINLTLFYVDEQLLREQEDFFIFVKNTLNYLNYKRRQLVGDIGAGAILRLPVTAPRPRMHRGHR